jgi:hypothetical protein
VVTLQNFCLYQSIIHWWVNVKNYYSIFICQYSGFDWAIYLVLLISVCCTKVEVVSQCSVTVQAKVCSQASPGGIFGRQSSSGTCFPPIILVFSCHYYSVNSPYSYIIHLHSTLHNLSSWQYRWTVPFYLYVVSLMVISVYMFVDSLVTFTYLCFTHSTKLGKWLTCWAYDVLGQHSVFPIKELNFFMLRR